MPRKPRYPDKPDDQPPVCPHCGGESLSKEGRGRNSDPQRRQRYRCRACSRISYGVRPVARLKCTDCQGALWEKSLPDGRTEFVCSRCGKHHRSDYIRSPRKTKEASRCRHKLSIALDRHARAGLVEYMQAARCSQAQAVRAMFRYVLTGNVLPTGGVSRRGRSGAIPIPRNPEAAAAKFPNLIRELAIKRCDRSTGYRGRGFQSLVLSVGRLTVQLDDEAKEGLVYAMGRLGMNHVDAARWLLANVKMPAGEPVFPLRPEVAPAFVCATGGKRRSSYPAGRYDPRWDDD